MANFLRGVREWATPTLKESAFLEKGMLTPEEFVAAGDQLVFRCPTWSWSAAEPGREKSYLPANKQYLITRRVPCRTRVETLNQAVVTEASAAGESGDVDDGWLTTHATGEGMHTDSRGMVTRVGGRTGAGAAAVHDGGDDDDLEVIGGSSASAPKVSVIVGNGDGHPDVSEMRDGAAVVISSGGASDLSAAIASNDHFSTSAAEASSTEAPASAPVAAGDDDDDYLDMATFEEDNIEEDDAAVSAAAASLKNLRTTAGIASISAESDRNDGDDDDDDDGLLRTRTYDVSVTYDNYYRTPRVWLFGYDESGQPLTRGQMFEDVIQDYVNRTVTVDPHPHVNLPHASVHPCRHASVMKRIVTSLCEGGNEPRTDQYLFIFLKFINSVVPAIEYDFTMEVTVKGDEGEVRGS